MERWNNRGGYGFSNATKELVRKRAGNSCDISDCLRPNTNRVNHLTGAFEAKLKGMPKRTCRSVDNATMQCLPHEIIHDKQEKEQIIFLLDRKRKKV